jgi:hypothetical protein
MSGPVETVLGRELEPAEVAAAFTAPVDSLSLPRSVIKSFNKNGLGTVCALAASPLNAVPLSPLRLRRVRQALLTALAGSYSLERLGQASLIDLPDRVRELLRTLEPRRRALIERENGLWDGHKQELSRAAKTVGVSYVTARKETDQAILELRRCLRVDSEEFHRAMRELYLKILAGKRGMAGVHEWEDQGSALYEGQIDACLGFAFLCRVSGVKPERLVTVGLDGACYDSVPTKYRHDQAVETLKLLLVNAGRPITFEKAQRLFKGGKRLELAPEFLRRCVEVSRELGFEKSGLIGLKAWPYFDAHSLHDMARTALIAGGEPTHYERIAEEIERLYPWRAPVNCDSLRQILNVHKDRFVLARHGGIFGLVEWPVKPAGSLKDFLVGFLRESGGRAKRHEMIAAAQEKHGFKAASVSFALTKNKELFRRVGWGQWELAIRS